MAWYWRCISFPSSSMALVGCWIYHDTRLQEKGKQTRAGHEQAGSSASDFGLWHSRPAVSFSNADIGYDWYNTCRARLHKKVRLSERSNQSNSAVGAQKRGGNLAFKPFSFVKETDSVFHHVQTWLSLGTCFLVRFLFLSRASMNRGRRPSRRILTMLSSRCSLPSLTRVSCHDVSLSSPAARWVSLRSSWGDRAAKEDTLSCGRNVLQRGSAIGKRCRKKSANQRFPTWTLSSTIRSVISLPDADFPFSMKELVFELVVKLRWMTRLGLPGGPLSSISMYPFFFPILTKLLISFARPKTYRIECK